MNLNVSPSSLPFECDKCERGWKTAAGRDKHVCRPKVVKPITYKCTYCAKKFVREKAYMDHVCKQKRRMFEKDTKGAKLAFHAFVHFHKVHYPSQNAPTYEKFATSSLYEAFLRFGKYILDINAITPTEYIDYMVRSTIRIDDWCSDANYGKYVQHLTMKEDPIRAFERSMILMQEWALKRNARYQDFFRLVGAPQAVAWVMSGKLSPWVMLNCQTGHDLIGQFTDEQLALTQGALNTKLWGGKFMRHIDAVNDIQTALREEGL